MRAWLSHGARAARLASDRADLWPAGALGALVYLGWLPLLLVVAPPDVGDLPLFGAALRASSAFPANVIALGLAVVSGIVLLCLLAAMAEAALLRAAAPGAAHAPFGSASLTAVAVILVAGLPVAAAVVVVLLTAIATVPTVYQSPDFGAPLAIRLLVVLLPALLLLVAAALAGQAFGGVALRRALAPGAGSLPRALADAVAELRRRPWPRIGVAAAGLLGDALMVTLTFALLRVLWAPIASELTAGRLTNPEALLLLVGFVAIWLGLLLAAGALHVMISAWWALELGGPDPASQGAALAA